MGVGGYFRLESFAPGVVSFCFWALSPSKRSGPIGFPELLRNVIGVRVHGVQGGGAYPPHELHRDLSYRGGQPCPLAIVEDTVQGRQGGVEVSPADACAVEPVVVRADVPETDQDVEYPEKLLRADPASRAARGRYRPGGGVLYPALLQLIEVGYVPEGEVVLQDPQGDHSVRLHVVPREGLHGLAGGELVVQAAEERVEVPGVFLGLVSPEPVGYEHVAGGHVVGPVEVVGGSPVLVAERVDHGVLERGLGLDEAGHDRVAHGAVEQEHVVDHLEGGAVQVHVARRPLHRVAVEERVLVAVHDRVVALAPQRVGRPLAAPHAPGLEEEYLLVYCLELFHDAPKSEGPPPVIGAATLPLSPIHVD